MSERKVSLRVSAVGGDKLKAELRSIGKEGQHALTLLETGGPGASRGLTATGAAAEQLMARLTRLSTQAAQAANSMGAVGASGTSVLARVNAATGVSGGVARDAADIAAYGRALDETRAKYNPMFAAIQRYRSELAELRTAHRTGAIGADEHSAALSRLRRASLHDIGVIKGRVAGYQHMAKGAGMARFQMVQLGYQINDIGVSLASGQNPFIVMIQQGAQIAQIYGGQGGVRAAFGQLGQMVGGVVTRFPLLTGAITLGSLAIAGMTREINKAGGEVVTFGDTALAVWQVVSEGVWEWIKPAAEKISEWFWWAWDGVVAGVKWAGNMLINGVTVTIDGIRTAVSVIPDMFRGAFAMAASHVMTKMHDMVWNISQAVNAVAGGLNEIFGTNLSTSNFAGAISFLSEQSGVFFRAGHAAQTRVDEAWAGFNQRASATMASDPMGAFFDTVAERARGNAANRTAGEEAGGAGGGGGGGGGKNPLEEEAEKTEGFLDKILGALNEYATAAMDIGAQIGEALAGAFKSAEDALVEFVKTGKLDIKELATSIIADFARIGIRAYIMGPLANALGSMIGGPLGQQLQSAFVQHDGGRAGSGPMRLVSAANFVTAPRLHDGMGGVRADEFAAILQRGERVLNRRETRDYESGRFGSSPTVVNFHGVRDMQSFRQSRTQVAADLSRALGMARRAS